MNNFKVAIIGPAFFGYCDAVASEMCKKGVPAFFINELFSTNKVVRAIIRIGLGKLFHFQKKKYYASILEKLVSSSTTDVLLISVEDLDPCFVAYITSMAINVHLYMWDGLDRKKICKKIIDQGINVASFDPVDAKALNCKMINLFAENIYSNNKLKCNERADSIVFAGTLHSTRPVFISDLYYKFRGSKFTVDGFFYYHSKILFSIRFLIKIKVLFLLKKISSNSFTKLQISNLFSSSKFVVDIPYPTQKGLTSRTFEALRAGAYLITTIESIEALPLCFHSRVVLYNSSTIREDLIRLSSLALPALTCEEEYYLSIERFVDEIFAFMKS